MAGLYRLWERTPLVRIGKQQIAWGAAIALRVLDIINHLDLSQFLFIDRAFEVVWVGLHLATDSLSDLLTVSEA